VWLDLLPGVVSFVLGLLLFLRLLSPQRRYDRMAMFTSFMLLTYGLLITGAISVIDETMEPWNTMIALVGFLATILFFLFMFIFPDGRFAPRWTVWVPWGLLAWIITWFFIPALNPGYWPPVYLNVIVVGLIMFAVGVQVYRYLRIYTPVQREQTKWIAFVLVVMLIVGIFQLAAESYLIEQSSPGAPVIAGYLLVDLVFSLLEALFPLTLFLIIVRYRLWEIDRLINKALVYGIVTALLAVFYFASVVLLQEVFRTAAGRSDSPLVIVASTLAIAGIFSPLRQRIQEFVDRRFYRLRYNAIQTLAEFSALAREEMEIEVLKERLLGVVQGTMQPDGVGLWLLPVKVRVGNDGIGGNND
jgi:hypothetical protein